MSELVIETAGKIVTVTIDRPPVNALTIALYGQIADTFEELGKRTDVHCAIFTGRGTRAFRGLDLARPQRQSRTERAAVGAALQRSSPLRYSGDCRRNGPALCRRVLASVCDIRVSCQ
jgi:enoyl-CoA hydratase